MNILNKIKLAFESPKAVLTIVLNRIGPLIKNDELFLRLKWKLKMGYPINLDNPHTFNEKLQWLKLHDHNPLYTTMVDKYEAKEYVGSIIGDEHIIPTIAVYDKVEDINFDMLPNQCVIKCTHDSGGLVICKDKSELDKKTALKKIRKCMHREYFWQNREWPYKNVKPRIIVEKYMEDESGELRDYKFMCFNGKVKCCFTCTERFSGEGLKVTFYDNDWNIIPFERSHPRDTTPISKPHSYEQMKVASEKLSEGLPFARIDFYEVNKHPLFGEITLYPGSGLEAFQPKEWDYKFGEWIKLPI